MLNKKALAGAPSVAPLLVGNVYSTTLYTGNGSSQTITNNIDLSGKGGLVWTKCRNDAAVTHRLNDTVRGITKRLFSSLNNAESDSATSITATSSTGYTVGSENGFNQNTNTFVSWTFRETEKFFDVVTFSTTTLSNTNRRISHSLNSVPGLILLKQTTGTQNWYAYHRSLGRSQWLTLNGAETATSQTNCWGTSNPTSTDFGIDEVDMLVANSTFVAYIFAHDAGGFGGSGTDSVIFCGSYTGNGSSTGPEVTIGWEPQWLLVKRTSGGSGDWTIYDSVRKTSNPRDKVLYANLTNAEEEARPLDFTSTGFQPKTTSTGVNANNANYVYVAIRKA